MPSIHELPYIVSIPRGNEVFLVTFTYEGKSPTLVLDRTTSILYSPQDLWGPLHQDPALAVTDPIAVVTRFAWTVQSTLSGTCVGALISTENYANEQRAKTRLIVEPTVTPYR